jgi:hypothetical protein
VISFLFTSDKECIGFLTIGAGGIGFSSARFTAHPVRATLVTSKELKMTFLIAFIFLVNC